MAFHSPSFTFQIKGNLGADPEMRYTPDGTPVCNFNVAINRPYTNAQGERVERTAWVRAASGWMLPPLDCMICRSSVMSWASISAR